MVEVHLYGILFGLEGWVGRCRVEWDAAGLSGTLGISQLPDTVGISQQLHCAVASGTLGIPDSLHEQPTKAAKQDTLQTLTTDPHGQTNGANTDNTNGGAFPF